MKFNQSWVNILKAIKKKQGNSNRYTACSIIARETGLKLEVVQENLEVLSELDFVKYATQHSPGSAYLLERGIDYLRDEAEARHLGPAAGGEPRQATGSNVRTILILAANPKGTQPLRLDEEVKRIEQGLERAKKRDQFKLVQKWAVTDDDLRRALLDHEPEIVHFSGHGSGVDGLNFENDTGETHLISGISLARLFKLCSNTVKCVVLNACYSEEQAGGIAEHIDFVVGMKTMIGGEAAINFAVGFYDALGAGRAVEEAFEFGRSAIDLKGIPEHLTPVLKKKS